MTKAHHPPLALHLATLNLFREADGSHHVTVQDWEGARLVFASEDGDNISPQTPRDRILQMAERALSPASDLRRFSYPAFTAMRNDINEMFGDMISQEATLLKGPEMSHECAAVVQCLVAVKERIERLKLYMNSNAKLALTESAHKDAEAEFANQACDRLFDMLLGDDGEAWLEAEKFIKQHRPDLYNKLGMQRGKT